MKIFEKKNSLKRHLEISRRNNRSIGFVPTMGALHAGHLALIERAKKENDLVVCSIFVNPTQFNNKEDLKKYPRTLKTDIKKLESVDCDILFIPNEDEMYPANTQTKTAGSEERGGTINFGKLDKILEGKFRPGHFKGVAIVVDKFFRIVEPDRAYFGEKDYQQLLIIKKMVEILKQNVRIIPCPTFREKDGLAMSSRNMRLTGEQRMAAPFIYKTLQKIKTLRKTLPPKKIIDRVKKEFLSNKDFKLEYFEIADAGTLDALKEWTNKQKAIACIAVYLGNIRLIDNIKLQ